MAAGEGEIQFPEPIIQRIQSLLTGKQAAQTAILSKSWHNAWLTRPNLDFDGTHFKRRNIQNDDFKKYAKKTIKRYEQSNLKIESFKLSMDIYQYTCVDFANKLIVKALRMGATRLCFRPKKKSHSLVLPDEVFGADNLVELSVSGCIIDLDDEAVIKCRSLESLSIDDGVDIKMDTFSNIILSCPSIENLSLRNIYPCEQENGYGCRDDNAIGRASGLVDNLLRLRCLVLGYVSFNTLCLGDLLFRFPFLKDFTLCINCSYIDTIFEEGLQISNCSLERIKLVLERFQGYEGKQPRVKFDVPSVRKFTYEGAVIPSLSFMSTTPPSREWESHVTIECQQDGFSTIWFNELSELLTQLSQSKTHLHVYPDLETFDYKVGDKIIQGLRKHELENLTIDMAGLPTLSCYALFDGLFRVCRPKLITQYYEDGPRKRRYIQRYENYCYKNDNYPEIITNIDFLCQTLEQGVHFRVSSPTQFMYGLNDLEEVNAQINLDVNGNTSEWRPIPLELLLDDNSPHKYVQERQRIRLLLKWKPI